MKSGSQNTSIPVHLYTGVLSIPVLLYTSHTNQRQYISLPVYQSLRKAYTSPTVYQSLKVTKKIPVYQFASIPVAAVTTLPLLMSAPYESSPLAAVVYESSPLAAAIIVDHICPNRPGVKLGLKDYHYTAW